jgi:hypothetical protein
VERHFEEQTSFYLQTQKTMDEAKKIKERNKEAIGRAQRDS